MSSAATPSGARGKAAERFRVHAMLELSESELPISFYSLVNVEDAVCLAEAHKEGQFVDG